MGFQMFKRPHRLSHWNNGAPERSRTPNLLIRSQALYPVELRARIGLTGSREGGNNYSTEGPERKIERRRAVSPAAICGRPERRRAEIAANFATIPC